jgi:predicted secreted protein
MANKLEECQGCPYNLPKTKGGHGIICNGNTQLYHNRCPEWRINEIRKERITTEEYQMPIYRRISDAI